MSANGHSSIEADVFPHREAATEKVVDRWQGISVLAESLAREFTAPVGVLDPIDRAWKIVTGAGPDDFPRPTKTLFEVAGSSRVRLGQVAVWRPQDDPGRVWLILPLPRANVTDAVAFVGFQDIRGPGTNPEALESVQLPQSSQSLMWGPACPDRALQAWGQKIASGMQSIHETHVIPVTTPGDDESERMVIGRLIRRMRISDSPTRFQGLATSVLKTSLGMAAVAWVPAESHEPVVVSGGVEGFRPVHSGRCCRRPQEIRLAWSMNRPATSGTHLVLDCADSRRWPRGVRDGWSLSTRTIIASSAPQRSSECSTWRR